MEKNELTILWRMQEKLQSIMGPEWVLVDTVQEITENSSHERILTFERVSNPKSHIMINYRVDGSWNHTGPLDSERKEMVEEFLLDYK